MRYKSFAYKARIFKNIHKYKQWMLKCSKLLWWKIWWNNDGNFTIFDQKIKIIKPSAGFEPMTYRLADNASNHCTTLLGITFVGKKLQNLIDFIVNQFDWKYVTIWSVPYHLIIRFHCCRNLIVLVLHYRLSLVWYFTWFSSLFLDIRLVYGTRVSKDKQRLHTRGYHEH